MIERDSYRIITDADLRRIGSDIDDTCAGLRRVFERGMLEGENRTREDLSVQDGLLLFFHDKNGNQVPVVARHIVTWRPTTNTFAGSWDGHWTRITTISGVVEVVETPEEVTRIITRR